MNLAKCHISSYDLLLFFTHLDPVTSVKFGAKSHAVTSLVWPFNCCSTDTSPSGVHRGLFGAHAITFTETIKKISMKLLIK